MNFSLLSVPFYGNDSCYHENGLKFIISEQNVFLIITLFFLIIVSFDPTKRFCKFSRKRNNKTVRDLPGPRPFPLKFIGNLFQLPKPNDFISKCFEWSAKYGSCFRLTFFSQNFVVISSAALAQDILQSSNAGHLVKPDVYKFLQGITGFAFVNGEWWRTIRRLAAEAFRFQQLEKQIEIYNRNGDQLLKSLLRKQNSVVATKLTREKKINLETEIAGCIAKIIIETFIGQPGICTSLETLAYAQRWKRYTRIIAYKILHPWLGLDFLWRLHPQCEELNTVVKDTELFAENLIHRHMEKTQMNNEKSSSNEDKSLISQMLKNNYSFESIQSEIVSLLFAHEVNSLGLYYLLYMLAIHPEEQKKCRMEVDELFDNRSEQESNDINPSDLINLKQVERCFLEAIRLLPPVYIFGRRLESPLQLSNGVLLPSGTNCIVLPIVIHKREEEWHENPSTFNPDRFLPENRSRRHSYAYLPFSAGPRMCIGMKSSILNVKILAAKILRKFELSSSVKYEDINFRLNLTTATEQDLDIKLKLRKTSTLAD